MGLKKCLQVLAIFVENFRIRFQKVSRNEDPDPRHGLSPRENANLKIEIFEFRSLNNLAQDDECLLQSSNITPRLRPSLKSLCTVMPGAEQLGRS